MRIAFVGAEAAGAGIGDRLVESGHAVAVREASDRLTDLCLQADVIVSALDDRALLDAVTRRDGLVFSMSKTTVHVAFGFHRVETIAAVAEAHAAKDQPFAAAPMLLGTTAEPRTVVVAGPGQAVGALSPLWEALNVNVFTAGPRPTSAALISLCHGGLVACALAAMSEAFALVGKFGVDAHVMHEVMTHGLFGENGVYRKYGAEMIDGSSTSGDAITVEGALEIIDMIFATSDEVKISLPSLDACRDRLLGAVARGHGQRRWTAINEEQARASGM
jgi:3-hydroxyisobutyrate dehydrogenase-like beta-hydroxyacid dehydrogenase